MEDAKNDRMDAGLLGKGAFGILLVAMPIISVCSGYSKWWLIGYVAVALGSVQALAACRLQFEHVAGLLIGDAVLAITVIVSFFITSIWIPIAQIVVAMMVGGSMFNLLEEQTKAKTKDENDDAPPSGGLKKYAPEPLLEKQEIDDAEKAAFEKFVEFARDNHDIVKIGKKLHTLVKKKNVLALNWLTVTRNSAAVDEDPEAMRFLALYYMTAAEDPIQYGRILGMAAARNIDWAVKNFSDLEEKYEAADRGDYMAELIIQTALREGCHCKDKYTERCLTDEEFYNHELDKQHLKSRFMESARREEPAAMEEVIAQLKKSGDFDEIIAEVRREASKKVESTFAFGYYLFVRSKNENDLNLFKWGIERIAKAARQDYAPAMKFVGRCYDRYAYGNLGAAEKNMLKGVLDIASEYCSPEYCSQNCVRLL